MANFSGVQNALASVRPAPSRLGGLASVISKVADRLRQNREFGQELEGKRNLLGYSALMEGKVEPTETGGTEVPGIGRVKAVREPKEYKPITREEALEFERAKKQIDYADIPPGFVTVGGKVYRDPSYKRPETTEERSANLTDEIAKKELSSMANLLPKLDQAVQSVDQLEALFNKGASLDKNPIISRVSGVGDFLGAKTGFNPKLNAYLNNRKAFAGLIAKGGFGEAGMLTNQDIERVVSALPGTGATPEEASTAFTEVRTLLKTARDRFERTKSQYLSGQYSIDSSGINSQGNESAITPEQAREILRQRGVKGY